MSDHWQPCTTILIEHNWSYGNDETMVLSNTCYSLNSTLTHAAMCSPWKWNLWSEISCREDRPHKDCSFAVSSRSSITDDGVSPTRVNNNINFSYNRVLAEEEDKGWYTLMQLLARALAISPPKLLYLWRTCLIHSWVKSSIIPLRDAPEVLPLLVPSGSILS